MKKIVLDKIAYVRHPVSLGLKQQLNGDGYQIIDAAFAPEGAKIIGETPAPSASTEPGAPASDTSAATMALAYDALALADGNFMAFKSAAKKALGADTPDKKDDIIAALKALAGIPVGVPTAIPDAWEAMTDEELLALAAEISGGPVTAAGEVTPVERARSIIQATVEDRASREK